MPKRKTPNNRQTPNKREQPNIIITIWKRFGCEMDHETSQRLYDSFSLRIRMWWAMRRLMKTMTPEQRAFLQRVK